MPRKRKPSLATAFGIILLLIVLPDVVDTEKEPYESHLDKRPYALTCFSGIGPVATMKPKECVPMNHFNKKPWCYLDWQYDEAKNVVYMAGGCTYGLKRRSCQQVLGDTVRCTCIGDLCNADLKCPDKFCKVCKIVNEVLIKFETEAPHMTTTIPPSLPLTSQNLPLLTFKPNPFTNPPTLLPKPLPKLLISNPKPSSEIPQPLPSPEPQIVAVADTLKESNSGTSQGSFLLLLSFSPLITTFYIHARLFQHHQYPV